MIPPETETQGFCEIYMNLKSILLDSREKFSTDVIFIVVANFTTLFGVIFLHWGLFSVLFLYWLESAMIGMFSILKILIAPSYIGGRLRKLILLPFFIAHYGGFMVGHLFLIYFVSFAPYIFTHNGYFPEDAGLSQEMLLPVLMLLFSHGFSFFKNYIAKKEYLKVSSTQLMSQPYGRIILMHITLLLGAVLVTAITVSMQAINTEASLKVILQSIVISIFSIFIILKILVDIKAHSKEHSTFTLTQ